MHEPDFTVVLGFDYGEKRIGVAVGQCLTHTATPVCILSARDGRPDWDRIGSLIKEWKPNALIVGMPVNMDDTEHVLFPKIKAFCRRLEQFCLPVMTVDERLSSREAESRIEGKHAALDAVAAQVILETWLSSSAQTT